MAKKKPRPAGEPTGQRPSVVVAVLGQADHCATAGDPD